MKNKIKLIIFDCYGPILSPGYPDTIRELSKRFKIPQNELFKIFYTKYFNQAAERKITQKEAWQKPVEHFNLPITWQEVVRIHIGLLKINKPFLDLAIKLRKNYKTLMLSKNTRSQFILTKKKFPKVWQSFDKVINTWELGLPKASPVTIKEVCRIFRVKPAEILYIDDQQSNLVEPKKMGVTTIFYKNLAQAKKELLSSLK